MKTLSRTFTFKLIVLSAVAIVAILTFRAFAQSTATPTFAAKKFTLTIGRTDTEFVDIKSKGELMQALTRFGKDQYDINYKDNDSAPVEHYPPPASPHGTGIKTNKVTTSEVAKNAPAGESAANDPNAVYRVSSDNTADIKAVLDTFK
jgi:hypothetical protein